MNAATELARLIGRVRRVNRASVSRALAEQGQSIHDWQVIANVKWQGAMTQAALADHIGAHPASISRLLDGLQRRGLIRRVADKGDRRCVTVHLSARGDAWYEQVHRPVMSALHANLSKLTVREQRQLETLLEKLLR